MGSCFEKMRYLNASITQINIHEKVELFGIVLAVSVSEYDCPFRTIDWLCKKKPHEPT